ncbi:DUF6932 family protein [Sphingomonas sp.]|uniref:DUF6932 family protein n=1 Tax=Sphingomonas sp. TaxID=28214 RepID=UPI00286CEB62|nr:hypothetical protein [Sphingomonas sp.]
MIPEFELGNVLPPFMGGDVLGQFHPRSPYVASMSELVARFATSPERATILRGLMDYRDALRDIGFLRAFQWIDGSFVEACELIKGRPPGDVDVISVVQRPEEHADENAWAAFVGAHANGLFDSDFCKATYSCDSYFIDLGIEPSAVSEQSAYWFGLFSHQRDTFRWKGLVQIDLQSDDEAAMLQLAEIEAAW